MTMQSNHAQIITELIFEATLEHPFVMNHPNLKGMDVRSVGDITLYIEDDDAYEYMGKRGKLKFYWRDSPCYIYIKQQ